MAPSRPVACALADSFGAAVVLSVTCVEKDGDTVPGDDEARKGVMCLASRGRVVGCP
jgi:hypothetical protein